jgi:hypothetical protein
MKLHKERLTRGTFPDINLTRYFNINDSADSKIGCSLSFVTVAYRFQDVTRIM